ncbi:MAG: hypothetical protein R2880_02675 [Deinococcales bacterium]
MVEHLNQCLGYQGWSFSYQTVNAKAIICLLAVEEVYKSAMVTFGDDPQQSAQDALVLAAEYFGLLPLADQQVDYWVDYDPETREMLYEPQVQLRVLNHGISQPEPSLLADKSPDSKRLTD